jgi:hypothetical protein
MILFKWHDVQERLKYLHRHIHISHAYYENVILNFEFNEDGNAL